MPGHHAPIGLNVLLPIIIVAIFYQLLERVFPHYIEALTTISSGVLCSVDPNFLHYRVVHREVPMEAREYTDTLTCGLLVAPIEVG